MRYTWIPAVALASLLAVAVAARAADEAEKPAATVEQPAEPQKVLFTENFDEYEDTDAWTGANGWTATVAKGMDAKLAIGKAYAREGKGLLVQNTQLKLAGPLRWLGVSRNLAEVAAQPVFTVSFHYCSPSAKPPDNGRVDFSINEPGKGQLLFVVFDPSAVSFMYEESKEKGGKYARGTLKPGEWHQLSIEVDQNKNKFRVAIDGKPVKGDWGEWAGFRYGTTAAPERAKSIAFSTANAWPSSVRHIDDFQVSVPEPAEKKAP